MTTKNIIKGLTILEKYRKDKDGYTLAAEHDQIYAFATDTPVKEEDLKVLIKMGWFQPEVDIGDDNDFMAKHYDAEENWSCFV